MTDKQTTGAAKGVLDPTVQRLPAGAGRQIARFAIIGALFYNCARPDAFLMMPLWQMACAVLMFAALADYGMGLRLSVGLFARRLPPATGGEHG